MGHAVLAPFVEHVEEEMILAFVIDQPGSIADVTLDGRVVKLRPQRLAVVLLIRHLRRLVFCGVRLDLGLP
jgi:hypothetical protein